MLISLIGIVIFAVQVSSRANYRDDIPHGYEVPSPCPTNGFWKPVGHYHPVHSTHLLNQFGANFRAANHQWTTELCNKDSDGDGKTNGQELGDPDCTWTKNTTPKETATGHPGICEPISEAKCHYQKFSCDCMEHCPGLDGVPAT